MEKINWTTVVISVVVAVVVFYLLSAFAPGLSPNYGTGVGQGTTFVNANACNKDEVCETKAILARGEIQTTYGMDVNNNLMVGGNAYFQEEVDFAEDVYIEADLEVFGNIKGVGPSGLNIYSVEGDSVRIFDYLVLATEAGGVTSYACIDGNGTIFATTQPCV